MKALRLLVILAVISVAAYYRVPILTLARSFHVRAPKPVEVAKSAATSLPLPLPLPTPKLVLPPPVDRTSQVIVLGYHRIADKVRHPDTEVTLAEFEEQMQALKDQGIAVISLDDFIAWRHEQKSIPPRCALITFDDGFNVAHDLAWPSLKKFGYPFTLFVYTDYVRGGPKAGGGSLSWEQLAEMRDAGISIQSHTVSHANLRMHKGAGYEQWLWHELNDSKALLEEKLGIKVTALALPFGLANDEIRTVAARAGYEMLFTVNSQKIGFNTAPESLGRYMVQANQPKLFASFTTFGGGAGASGPAVATLPAQGFHPRPAPDSIIYDPNPLIQADLTTFGPVEAGTASMRVSALGEVAANFNPQTKLITYQARALQPNKYTVIVAAKAAGKRLEGRWSFTVERPIATTAMWIPTQ